MAWVESLQRAIDYMEDHLYEDITIEEIAKQAHSSPFHFQRTFTLLTDITVGDYLRRRRLSLAVKELTGTDTKIIDLACKYGYDTPEAFSKAFRKQHGVTPTEARKGIGKLQFYNRLVIQVSLKGAEPVKYHMVEREAFQVVGVKRAFSYENGQNLEGIPKMWQEVHQNGVNDLLFRVNSGQIKGVLGVCVDQGAVRSKEMDYWIATECDQEVPEGLEKLDIPASKWAVFEVRGPMPDAMQSAWKRIFSEWFPSSGYEYTGTAELEVYTDEDPSSPDLYSEIWIPVK